MNELAAIDLVRNRAYSTAPMRFTLITPVLNGMPWLPECVGSVASQRGDVEIEHIVLDPGSTDGSREWLEANTDPADTRLIFEQDAGQTSALRRGFEEGTGDVFGWLNADDLLERGALAAASAALEADPEAVAVTGRCVLLDPSGEATGEIPLLEDTSVRGILSSPTNLAQPATFFRRRAYETVGGLDPSLDLAMDVDLWLKLAALGRIIRTDAVLARFRIHPDAKTVAGLAAAMRQDLALRLRRGMRPWSPAGRHLLRYGVLAPARDAVLRRLGMGHRKGVRE